MCEVESYLPDEVEVDEFEYAYSANERPHIRNDIFSLNRRQVADYQVRGGRSGGRGWGERGGGKGVADYQVRG